MIAQYVMIQWWGTMQRYDDQNIHDSCYSRKKCAICATVKFVGLDSSSSSKDGYQFILMGILISWNWIPHGNGMDDQKS
jgi:hypothetical protein